MSLDFFGTRDAVDFEDDEGLSASLFRAYPLDAYTH